MKLMGSINGQQVLVLIDSGAPHNFIPHTAVEKLKLPIKVELQGLLIKQYFYPFYLTGTNIVFGYEWLVSLG